MWYIVSIYLHYTQYIRDSQSIEYGRIGSSRGASYDQLQALLSDPVSQNITEYQLIYNYGFSANTLHRMKHGRNITLKTLDTLCSILECDIADIISYHPDEA